MLPDRLRHRIVEGLTAPSYLRCNGVAKSAVGMKSKTGPENLPCPRRKAKAGKGLKRPLVQLQAKLVVKDEPIPIVCAAKPRRVAIGSHEDALIKVPRKKVSAVNPEKARALKQLFLRHCLGMASPSPLLQ